MINDKYFKQQVIEYFQFLTKEFDFNKPIFSSNSNIFFDMEYKKANITISISYEVIEDYLQIFFLNKSNDNKINNYDSSDVINFKTLRPLIFRDINSRCFDLCRNKFSEFSVATDFSKKLYKEAKDLFLCLNHLNN